MPDISISEIIVILAISMLILGPARTVAAGRLLGRLAGTGKKYLADLEKELKEQADNDQLKTTASEVNSLTKSLESSLSPISKASLSLKDQNSATSNSTNSKPHWTVPYTPNNKPISVH